MSLLDRPYTGYPLGVFAKTNPPGLTVRFSYDGDTGLAPTTVGLCSQQGRFPEDFFFVQAQGRADLATSPVGCLSHSDFQAQNILRSAPGMIHLIDWEGPFGFRNGHSI